jgi:hypothetical protein
MMQAAIPYHGGELEARWEGGVWTVRLGELDESSIYLDFALAQLLDDDTARVHHLATMLIEALLPVGQAFKEAPQPASS